MKNRIIRNSVAVLASFVIAGAAISANTAFEVSAEQAENVKVVVTDYADLWTSTDITVEEGTTVQWYVSVPDGTEPRGCGATVKIPGLGFGTDTHNKEEGHIVLQQGENFIYEFTPDEPGDILFTCWMGSGCHKNYIHVTQAAAAVIEDLSSAEVDAPESTVSVESATESAPESVSNTDISSSAADSSVSESAVSSSSSISESSSKTVSTSSSANTANANSNSTNSNPKTGKSVIGSTLATLILIGSAALLIRKRKN
ncbi:LPXTG cell wall anchor domain-containing protein [Ruminococcus albus]|uniref:LPXTG-motif cell wall anchor domain-containing protein n=1 Tax=Ruminococcus albus TaxID=1264 RepID=A0A1I1F2E5_RUMAL|nr:LPXTG cell wall anchor domain-containing protein [Ruminococcus albus]SFB93126.1 LPXTG-motif cell wall anchor domain-containing protein [Ruminococcus albus]